VDLRRLTPQSFDGREWEKSRHMLGE
jgi:hypothetical protein